MTVVVSEVFSLLDGIESRHDFLYVGNRPLDQPVGRYRRDVSQETSALGGK